MVGLLIGLAVVVAVVALGAKRARKRREERRRPGASPETAIHVDGFDAIDFAAEGQRCGCGRRLRRIGEDSRVVGDRRLRLLTCECDACGHVRRVYFDVTQAFH